MSASTADARTGAMTVAPIPRALLTFALPILLGNALQSASGLVNAIWVGRFLGPEALAAVGNTGALLALLTGAVFGIATVTGILIGQAIGGGQEARARHVFAHGAIVYIGVALMLAGIGILGAGTVLESMNVPLSVMPDAERYMRVAMIGLPFAYAAGFMFTTLRSTGDARTPLLFLAADVLLDIALNPLFIRGWGPLPALGIAGSALASLLVQAVTVSAMGLYLWRSNHVLSPRRDELRAFRLDFALLQKLLLKGLPIGLQTLVSSLSLIVMIGLVNRFGSTATAAYTACFQVWAYVQLPLFALNTAVTTMAAQNIGARRWERVGVIARTAIMGSVGISALFAALLCLASGPVFALLLPNAPEAVAMAVHINAIAVWLHVPLGVFFVLAAVVRAAGSTVPPLVVLVTSAWGVRVMSAWLLIDLLQANAIWISFPLGATAAMLLMAAYYFWGGWRRGDLGTA